MFSRRGFLAGAKIRVQSFYARVTLNRLAATFFVLSFLSCFAQGIMHAFLFSIDSQYSTLMNGITRAAQIPPENHTYLEGSSGDWQLFVCDFIPHTDKNCGSIFNSKTDIVQPTSIAQDSKLRGDIIERNLNGGLHIVTKNVSLDYTLAPDTNITAVSVEARDGSSVVLVQQCTGILLYPQEQLQNARREDLSFVALQFWLLAMSVIALAYDSVPHLLASFGARMLVAGWSMYALWRTQYQRELFYDLIEEPGTPCSVEIFTTYFATRKMYEIPDLVLNCAALLVFSFLSWNLTKVFNTQSFQRVGPPDRVMRIYKFFMAVQACLQLEVFVLFTAMGLWIDQLFTQYIHKISEHTVLYEGLFICTTILLIPWITMGWYAIRYEMRKTMVVFIGITIFFLVSWSIMFASDMYRWTFIAWPNLGCYTVASFILMVASMILGVVCRLNFGKGLAQYLHAEDALASTNFTKEVFEREADVEKASPIDERKARAFEMEIAQEQQQPVPTYYVPTLHSRDSSPEPGGPPPGVAKMPAPQVGKPF